MISYSHSNRGASSLVTLRSRYSSTKGGNAISGIGQSDGIVGWPFRRDVLFVSPRREKFDISRASPAATSWQRAMSEMKVPAPKREILPRKSRLEFSPMALSGFRNE